MITQEQAEKIVSRYSPTTKVSVHNTDSTDGIYLQKTNTISIAHNWSVAGLLHEITHAVLILEDGRAGHDGVFADRFTKIVDDYYGWQVELLQEQLKLSNKLWFKWYESCCKAEHQLYDANQIISEYRCYDDTEFGKATEYCKKWGVK